MFYTILCAKVTKALNEYKTAVLFKKSKRPDFWITD